MNVFISLAAFFAVAPSGNQVALGPVRLFFWFH
jgi:hypothetical protein